MEKGTESRAHISRLKRVVRDEIMVTPLCHKIFRDVTKNDWHMRHNTSALEYHAGIKPEEKIAVLTGLREIADNGPVPDNVIDEAIKVARRKKADILLIQGTSGTLEIGEQLRSRGFREITLLGERPSRSLLMYCSSPESHVFVARPDELITSRLRKEISGR